MNYEAENVPELEDWDEDLADDLVGKIVVVAITRLTSNEELIGQHQVFGRVVSADENQGIEVRLEGESAGEVMLLPPAPLAFEPAAPGRYTLSETGEIVENPDFTCAFTVTEPECH